MIEKRLGDFINILSEIAKSMNLPFWMNWSFWLTVVSAVLLIVTLFFLVKSNRVTQKILQHQITPAIDVNMFYEKKYGKTYFWFKNHSNLSGFVYLNRKKNDENIIEVYQELRISPKENARRTAITFDFSQKEGDKLKLYISIRPAIEKTKIKFEFEKSYTFTNNCWNENSWSFPDNPFPLI